MNANSENKIWLSLVIATVGRTEELERLLQTLVTSDDQDFEVIIADQNEDERLAIIVNAYERKLNLKHLRLAEKNASKARNKGAELAKGSWLGFPDDDCCYLPHTISRMKETACNFPADAIAGVVTDFEGIPLINVAYTRQEKVSLFRFSGKICEPSFFIKKKTFYLHNGFNEEFGPGGKWPAGEGFDLAIRLLKKGVKTVFNPAIKVLHPRKISATNKHAAQIAYTYSYGFGCLLAKHFGMWALVYLSNFFLRTTHLALFAGKSDRVLARARLKALSKGFILQLKSSVV